MNYEIKPGFDPDIAFVMKLGTIENSSPLNGLIYFAVKTTSGAPAATPNVYMTGCLAINTATGVLYRMTGTPASPAWS